MWLKWWRRWTSHEKQAVSSWTIWPWTQCLICSGQWIFTDSVGTLEWSNVCLCLGEARRKTNTLKTSYLVDDPDLQPSSVTAQTWTVLSVRGLQVLVVLLFLVCVGSRSGRGRWGWSLVSSRVWPLRPCFLLLLLTTAQCCCLWTVCWQSTFLTTSDGHIWACTPHPRP